jgi:hypothetical protein
VPELLALRTLQVHLFADQSPQHSFHSGHDGVQIEHLGIQDLLAAECQELTGQHRGSIPGLANLLEMGSPRFRQRQAGTKQLAITENGREEVVEVVGDASGQYAHRFDLLRLTELILQLLAGRIAQRQGCQIGDVGGEMLLFQSPLPRRPHVLVADDPRDPAVMPDADVQ